MQPEVKQKIDKPKKELTPDQQWDVLAYKVIESNLAPKGFKKVNNGKFRNLEIVNSDLPGLPKSKVQVCQRQAAQLVRGFRDMAKKNVDKTISVMRITEADINQRLGKTPFYKILKRMRLKYELEKWRFGISCHEASKDNLNDVNIK